ncbi:hypothetical protein EV213_10794 [Aureibacillus halotolerans]|uniref:Uncharacterized protein n=1 Tax=Aureibacillus halotolerans TaxID=1508390 RepID=A0A4V6PWH5_9BACI|nr:hypothetical protein EV213_10794 [Aureibacillus halotolerans]
MNMYTKNECGERSDLKTDPFLSVLLMLRLKSCLYPFALAFEAQT